MSAYLQEELNIEVDGAETREETLSLIDKNGPYICVLADLRMPGMDTSLMLEEIVTANAPNPVCIFSGAATYSDLFLAAELGVAGYIKKSTAAAQVADAIRQLLETPEKVPDSMKLTGEHHLSKITSKKLSKEDMLILGLLSGGARNTEIARRLKITRTHVETRLRAIYKALGVSSRLAAATLIHDTQI